MQPLTAHVAVCWANNDMTVRMLVHSLIGYVFEKFSFNNQQTVPIIRLAIRLDQAFCAENTPCVKQEGHGSKGAAKK
jgi:hypothetical protein